jgi:hypothetical protein
MYLVVHVWWFYHSFGQGPCLGDVRLDSRIERRVEARNSYLTLPFVSCKRVWIRGFVPRIGKVLLHPRVSTSLSTEVQYVRSSFLSFEGLIVGSLTGLLYARASLTLFWKLGLGI